jgi:zinc transport system ATP-binding protein
VAALPVIDVSGLAVRREGRTLLERVSLQVAAGTIHAIVGPNGAGKSTLVAALLGQIAFVGSIRFHLRGSGRIGYVPQSFAADRTLPITVAEFLALPRQGRPVCLGLTARARLRIGAILERVGLAGFERRRLGELSGGELRRVLIANAIEPAPEVLLCDEPGTGLDTGAVVVLDRILRTLRDEAATTIVMVSHDADQVRRLADHVTQLGSSPVPLWDPPPTPLGGGS